MATLILPDKDPSGDLILTFNFTVDLLPGESISSVVVTCEVLLGFDSTPSSMLSGSASLTNSPLISQKVIGGVDGTTYKIRAVAATSAGRNLLRKAILPTIRG